MFFDKIVIATNNKGKLKEFAHFLSCLPIEIVPQPVGIDIKESGKTFADNARLKAYRIADITGELALADDSGLCVSSLDGRPGIYSARYAKTDQERISKLLKELENFKNREAYFCSAICLASPSKGILIEVEGRCEGIITTVSRGDKGFGYDPIFEVKGTGLTYAEMNLEVKKNYSHRGKALEELMKKLKGIIDISEK